MEAGEKTVMKAPLEAYDGLPKHSPQQHLTIKHFVQGRDVSARSFQLVDESHFAIVCYCSLPEYGHKSHFMY